MGGAAIRTGLAASFEGGNPLLEGFQPLLHLGSGIAAEDAFAGDRLAHVVETGPEIVQLGIRRLEPSFELLVDRLDGGADVAKDIQRPVLGVGHGHLRGSSIYVRCPHE